jgi:hypothetical protein
VYPRNPLRSLQATESEAVDLQLLFLAIFAKGKINHEVTEDKK